MKPWQVLEGEKVVVTGGAGFVGSNIVAELLAVDADVLVVDDLSTGHIESAYSAPWLMGCVTDSYLLEQAFDGAHTVIHAAARNIIVSTKNPVEDCNINVVGTLNVLLAAREAGVKRIVYTSSCSIYGNQRSLPIDEEATPNLLTPYAVSKYAGESYCRAFYESFDMPTAVVRYSNVYGPGQRPENPYCGVVAKFFDAALTSAPLQIHGDGEQTRDYTFVSDAVSATLTAAVSPKAIGNTYNVATGREVSVNDLAVMVGSAVGAEVEIVHVDRRDIDNIRRRAVSIEKIRRELRWIPGVSLERGLAETCEWYAATPVYTRDRD